ncbi:3-oxoacyl-ACP reductase FabG [Microbacteriaceae bacterium VKM Ac-2855]|nr:3-oxoacyl-ACP reductase FabG [Microbacteriaceae bacterium VKM Ac-2855]
MTTTQKIALVTGAARGIGAAIAGVLAERGFRVVLADVDAAQASATAAALGEGHEGIALNVADSAQVDAAVDGVVERHGQLHVVVNNAGINRDAMLHKMTDQQWDQVLAVDLSAVFYVSRAAARHMRQTGYGRIVNISSASWEGNIGQANYAAAKAGVLGLTFTLARELARSQVTANAICPGFIDTEMTRGIPEAVHAAQIAKIPLGYAGDPTEVGKAVAFFASDDASYLTGQVLEVGGGYRI